MRRRDIILGLGAGLALRGAARAETPDNAPRLGIFLGNAASDPDAQARIAAFLRQLSELGWTSGRNLRVDTRWAAAETDDMKGLARQLVELRPKVILAHTTPVTVALREIAGTTPVVFVTVTDPVRSGIVGNLAHPGGNITGFLNVEASLAGKWLEVLREVAPATRSVALLHNPRTAPFADYYLAPFREAAAVLGLNPIPATVGDVKDIAPALARHAGNPGAGLVMMPDVFMSTHRAIVIAQAARLAMPALYPYAYMCREGGLVSYGIDQTDTFRRAAAYVDRILRGAKAGDLPVQAPGKFEFVINLKAARAMGLDVPDSLVARADEVVE